MGRGAWLATVHGITRVRHDLATKKERDSNRCEVEPYYSFDLHFPDNWLRGASFHVPTGHLCVFFEEMSVKVFCPFFYRFICFVIELYGLLYILEVKPLSVASFANILSHSVDCLFILFMVSFMLAK